MSTTIERGRALILEMIDGLQQEIEETGLMECFKDYLLDQNYVSEGERASLPHSAKQICDLLAERYGWSITYTTDTLMDFGKQSRMLSQDEDEDDRGASGTIHDWNITGF